ncbi:uncharacterized protein LOC105196436 isoform X2 [Solenopsis invicta]|uniref:uncharacterized protein LOC105196436 isoform X2 n=1 Tax=Solenopsis invicta TaxID=13686 RepID=UPI00193C9D3C|nr:uncharacterized protein LOC105196436 isoform X2 [Solenopsis invicta]
MSLKKLEVYVNNELWQFDVSDTEFQAAITGNEKVIKFLVARESERRSMAVINKDFQESRESADTGTANEVNKELQEPGESADICMANEIKKDSFVWPDQAVLLFLETYREKESEFALGLKRHNKIWLEIANEMKKANYNVNATQCQNKMSGLKRTYKNISDSNKKSGNHSSSWAFYSIMESIFGEKAWIVPASIASSDGLIVSGSSSSLSEKTETDEPRLKKRRVESILESFITEMKENKQKDREDREKQRLEKIAEKENRRQQINQEQWTMHKERIQIQQSLIEILSKIAERNCD